MSHKVNDGGLTGQCVGQMNEGSAQIDSVVLHQIDLRARDLLCCCAAAFLLFYLHLVAHFFFVVKFKKKEKLSWKKSGDIPNGILG